MCYQAARWRLDIWLREDERTCEQAGNDGNDDAGENAGQEPREEILPESLSVGDPLGSFVLVQMQAELREVHTGRDVRVVVARDLANAALFEQLRNFERIAADARAGLDLFEREEIGTAICGEQIVIKAPAALVEEHRTTALQGEYTTFGIHAGGKPHGNGSKTGFHGDAR